MSAFKFSLKKHVLTLPLENEDGTIEDYELRELSAAARDAYLTRLGKRVKIGSDGKGEGVADFVGLQGDLVSCCLFHKDGKAISLEEIQKAGALAVGSLFKMAQELNGLDREHEEAALKNE